MGLNAILPCLSDGINAAILELPKEALKQLNEIRIRKNKPVVLVFGGKSLFITKKGKLINFCSDNLYSVSADEFELIFKRLCNYSVHCEMGNLINGFLTTNGGNRVGVCSTAVRKNGCVTAIKDITSFNIRISNEFKGCAKPVINLLYVNELPSIIVASPPGGGKTTFLRDLARQLSGGFNNSYRRITIIDERNEIAFRSGSDIIADIGVNTDVISSFDKAKGIEMAVRTLNPELIICDEISSPEEVSAVSAGFLSGTGFAVSVHASGKDEVLSKPVVKKLLSLNEFDYIVLLNSYTNDFEIMEVS